MSVSLREPMTLAEFLEWEERQEPRWEFDGIQAVAMTGGSDDHTRIQVNLSTHIDNHLRGRPCRFYNSDHRFQVEAGHVRYPDGMVLCRPFKKTDTIVYNPTIVFEVTSQSTRGSDFGLKRRDYQDTPSVQRYVIIEQDFIGATVYARSGGTWIEQALSGGDTLALPEIGFTLSLAELYYRTRWQPEPEDQE
jgi:Uma2 family endonuclease